MGRKLSTTVQVGPYIYEAGTDEADIQGADTIAADVWDGEIASSAPEAGAFTVAEVVALREQYDAQIAERDEQIEALRAEVEQLKAAAPESDPDADAPADYSSLDLDALKAEIDRRNEGRDDADRIGKRGSVETLVAALLADDEAQD